MAFQKGRFEQAGRGGAWPLHLEKVLKQEGPRLRMENRESAVRDDFRERKKELGEKKKKTCQKGSSWLERHMGSLMNFNATRKLS